jgi:ABC-2 type transport system ATP-binding protein
MSSDIPIRIQDLSKTYRLGFFMNRSVKALQGLNLSVEPGQVYGLLGPNGAGKSTTIKILMNLVRASSGEARVFGLPPDHNEARQRVGFLPENPAPYEYLSGREFVRLAAVLSGLSGADLRRRVDEVLESVGMERAADLQIRRYSKGMIQRVSLAQAVVSRPSLLILDEPTSGLDPVGRRQVSDLILAERKRGTTVLLCTHIISDVEAVCDRVIVLVGGRPVREGSVQQLLAAQATNVEITVEGIPLERLTAMKTPTASVEPLGDRVFAKVPSSESQRFVRAVLEAGGTVTQLQSSRVSLEDLFIEALSEAKQGTVGGEIS